MSCSHLEDSDVLADLEETSDSHVEHCADCHGRLHAFRQIAQLIADGETAHSLPGDWKQRTLERILPTPPPGPTSLRGHRRRSVLVTTLGLASISLILLVAVHLQETPNKEVIASVKLQIQLLEDEGWRAAPQNPSESMLKGPWSAHPGQFLHAQVSVGLVRYFEIRIYRSSRDLLVRCPSAGAVECREAEGPQLSWKIPSVGVYQVILLTSQQPIASPRGTFEQDISAVLSAGGKSIDVETIDVH